MGSTQQPVSVSLRHVPLSTLEDAFGPSSLGIIIVKDLHSSFRTLRRRLLTLASHLAQLPEEQLDLLVNPQAHYNVGWSHGVEALRPGVYDTSKGSFYATVLSSEFASRPDQPELEYPNIWPSEDLLPDFRETFEELCAMIIDIGILVARACDVFAAHNVPDYLAWSLERIVKESTMSRARLLHYFPQMDDSGPEDAEGDDSWCAAHVDDGGLTGLTSALFLDESAPLPSYSNKADESLQLSSSTLISDAKPDPQAGLYIRSRAGEVIKVSIPSDCLAFQTGSALELMTKGKLKAVEHFVRAPSGGEGGKRVARNTLAVFMQPSGEEVVDFETGKTFGEHIRDADERHA
ncbi:uncharacterized protein PAC_18161 [Phialocephala subalpina]|uniref:Clavaminate synthase-like protein n=1 Tax=Phialocephala subalpina TaxID=576137 RepID=A0A1L7XT96_9HELO|nr:uncharacterized protein PAC_18161 [Phialocephala subalpina]